MADQPPSGRLSSGIPGLDVVLGGGFFRGRIYSISGAPGTGKTVLGTELCFRAAAAGERAAYFTMLGESHACLISNLGNLAYYDAAAVPDRVTFISGVETLETGGLEAFLLLLRQTITRQGASVAVLDSLSTPEELSPSPHAFRRFLRELATVGTLLGCTLFLVNNTDAPDSLVPTIAEGALELSRTTKGIREQRLLTVSKFRGSEHLAGSHAFDISRRGVEIHPRLESLSGNRSLASPRTAETLVPFGVPQLDAMLHGGLRSASNTVLLGAPGAGKTTLGLHLLAAGVAAGRSSLYFGLYESPDRLLDKAAAIGLDLSEGVRDGTLAVHWEPVVENSIDALAGRLLDLVDRRQVQRLFVDGIDAFLLDTVYPERIGRFFTALTSKLRERGVTTVFSQETDFLGPRVNRPVRGVSMMYENILMLRFVELRSQLYRLLSILKVRDGDYDNSLRELRITSHGVTLEDTFDRTEEILSGLAHPAAPTLRRPPARRTGRHGTRRRGP